MKVNNSQITEKEIASIQKQLNRKDVSLAGIAKRCAHGYPQIVFLRPDPDSKHYYTAISNPVWLTCPFLNKQIHNLESEGFIGKISSLIATNMNYAQLMEKAHAHYYFIRKNISAKFLKEIDKSADNIFSYGIGGTRERDYIKCLHTHYAHHSICGYNIIGDITERLLHNCSSCKDGICNDASKN